MASSAREGYQPPIVLLKLNVAAHHLDFGLTAVARPSVEYGFRTDDRVDVLLENHDPDRTVAEIEVAGEDNVCVRIHPPGLGGARTLTV